MILHTNANTRQTQAFQLLFELKPFFLQIGMLLFQGVLFFGFEQTFFDHSDQFFYRTGFVQVDIRPDSQTFRLLLCHIR